MTWPGTARFAAFAAGRNPAGRCFGCVYSKLVLQPGCDSNTNLRLVSLMNFRRSREGYPVGAGPRGLLAVWVLFLVAGFAVARSLDPDPRGYGTHQRLGLPECSLRMLFGIPCPSCGMTTSFANFTRGRFVSAFRANPAGLMLAAVCAVQVPWGLASVVRGRLLGMQNPSETAFSIILVLVVAICVNWGVLLYQQFRS